MKLIPEKSGSCKEIILILSDRVYTVVGVTWSLGQKEKSITGSRCIMGQKEKSITGSRCIMGQKEKSITDSRCIMGQKVRNTSYIHLMFFLKKNH